MSDTFEIALTQEQRNRINWTEVQEKAKEYGIELATNGTFNGKAVGTVVLWRDKAVITLVKRPWLVPLAMIKSSLEKMLIT